MSTRREITAGTLVGHRFELTVVSSTVADGRLEDTVEVTRLPMLVLESFFVPWSRDEPVLRVLTATGKTGLVFEHNCMDLCAPQRKRPASKKERP